ncbi:MAG: SDR family oxidoreductase [Telmatospirillum sp.]|nr:SDR family oxidoreductase [Telmatospirillum sp.]
MRGRKALVTGSTRGIGRAIAVAFADAGATVFLHGLERDGALEAELGVLCAGFDAADLAQAGGADRLHDAAVAAMGRVDILVLCASAEIREMWDRITPQAEAAQLAVNFSASVRLLTRLVPTMAARGWGRVVAIGSVQETHPNGDCLVYVATKAAQTAMMRTLARHASAAGVTFNTIKPGAIETDRNTARLADPAFRANVVARIPAGRLGAPEDCAGIAVALCSDSCGYVNGAEIPVDGGMAL